MFGTHFYHKRVRSAVSVFGSLFNNLYVLRQNSAGETISQVKVPLSYAPKRNFLARIEAMTNGEQNERVVAIKLPRMSFEINGIAYDETRQLNKMNNLNKVLAGSTVSRQKLFTATPYNINFDLNVYAKSQDDALQIVEQIFPFFTPQYTVSVKPFTNIALSEDGNSFTRTAKNKRKGIIIRFYDGEQPVYKYPPVDISKEENLFEGECYVFDKRVALDQKLEKGSYLICHACGMPISIQDQERKEYRKGIQCHFCIDQFSDDDRKRFEERQKQIDRSKVENHKINKD